MVLPNSVPTWRKIILPYHDFGTNKYDMLGKDYEMLGTERPDEDYMKYLKSIVEAEGLYCQIGG